MAATDRPALSRRQFFRTLLGRGAPSADSADRTPTADPHAAGNAAYAAGDFPAAVVAYRASVRQDLANTALRTRLGQALYATGQYIQARVEFEHVLRLTDGAAGPARLGLALTLLRLGRTARAGQLLAAFADTARPALTALAQTTAAAVADGAPADLADRIRALEEHARASRLFSLHAAAVSPAP